MIMAPAGAISWASGQFTLGAASSTSSHADGVEPVSAAAGAVLGAAERAGIVQNLLGPISKSIEENWGERYRQRNLARPVRKGARRAGSQLSEPGGVHPRVAHRILEEGSYVEDEVMLEYLAGILAAARTPDGRDDRGAYYAKSERTGPGGPRPAAR